MLHDRLYKITDFGLAKIVNSLVDKLTISFKGTPLYMAPEMIQEEAVADPKIDMWSLGVIVYRMLYNKYPFLVQNKKYDKETAFADIVNNPLTFPPIPKRTEFITTLLEKMLKKSPKERISWEEMF
jgi:serine/threonine-protein kinase ULK/ATG1